MDRILNLTETNDVLNGGLLIVTCVVYPSFFSQYNQDLVRGRFSFQRALRESSEIIQRERERERGRERGVERERGH